jgi:putative nucleotidyltransferase with HDIG domain
VTALDIRDKETEGHTQRVTVLTQRLAQKMGVDRDAMEHITRGALLHDIGKMAISDEILRKKGKLTPEERAVMEEHPVYAYKMLSAIEFLRPALDIPYCHHEKWDGTGYPRRLKGEEIPFAARIFSVIDVWDALTSERHYHKALPHQEVRQKIKADADKHFDPRVVEAFMDLEDLSV